MCRIEGIAISRLNRVSLRVDIAIELDLFTQFAGNGVCPLVFTGQMYATRCLDAARFRKSIRVHNIHSFPEIISLRETDLRWEIYPKTADTDQPECRRIVRNTLRGQYTGQGRVGAFGRGIWLDPLQRGWIPFNKENADL